MSNQDKILLAGYAFVALVLALGQEWGMLGALLIGLSMGAIIARWSDKYKR